MGDQLLIDSNGAWVRKTAQLIAEKPLLPPEHFELTRRAKQRLRDYRGGGDGDGDGDGGSGW